MSIIKKIIIIIISVNLLVTAILVISSQIVLQKSFNELENQLFSRNVKRVGSFIDESLLKNGQLTKDWAFWDDCYAYMQNKNEEFITSNLPAGQIATMGLNLAVFVDENNKVVYQQIADNNGQEKKISEKDLAAIQEVAKKDNKKNDGVINFPDLGLFMISAEPILKSDRTGPADGTLIFGRMIDENFMQNVSKATIFTASLLTDKEQRELMVNKDKFEYLADQDFVIDKKDKDNAFAYAAIRDLNGVKVATFRVKADRSIFKEGQNSTNFIMGSLLISMIISMIVFIFLINSIILKKLSRLSSYVKEIKNNPKGKSLVFEGNDEVEVLSQEIEGMIKNISKVNFELAKKIEDDKIKTEELEKINKLMISRELKMAELKGKSGEMDKY